PDPRLPTHDRFFNIIADSCPAVPPIGPGPGTVERPSRRPDQERDDARTVPLRSGLDGLSGRGQNAGPREGRETGDTPGTSPSRCGERIRRMTTPGQRTRLLPHVLTLAAGVALGALAAGRAPAIRAGGGDRWDESVLATGPTFVKYNEGSKI